MTWALLICSSLLFSTPARLPASGVVSGRVELVNSSDRGVKRKRDFGGVVVWLEPSDRRPAPTDKPHQTATMLQRDKKFTPHVLPIQVGTAVNFPNADPIFHNAFSTFEGQIFDIGLYPPGTSRKVVFRRPGIVRVFCNIHPMMSAVIAVVPTPWFTLTDRNGAFRIEHVPAGEYRLKLFHERALPETLKTLERKLRVNSKGASLKVIRISESGYVAIPHKNKHGKDYPPQPDEHLLYPGVKP